MVLATHEMINKNHVSIEDRRYALSTDIDWLEQRSEWTGLKSVVMVESTRMIGETTSTERRYYLTSLTDLSKVADPIRAH